jgi:hypothetical protein
LTSSFNMTPPSHYHNDVRGHLNDWLPQRWFGHAAAGDQELLRWPPRSPDLTPWFLLVGLHQGSCLYPHLQTRWLTCARASQLTSWKFTPTCYMSLGRTWLPAWCVPCYAWSAHWTFVMRLKKTLWVFLFISTNCVYLRCIKLV